jgi:hypothetical protein
MSMTIPDLETSDLILSPTRSPHISATVNDLPGPSGLRCPSAENGSAPSFFDTFGKVDDDIPCQIAVLLPRSAEIGMRV